MKNSFRVQPTKQSPMRDLAEMENELAALIETDDLDRRVSSGTLSTTDFDRALDASIERAFQSADNHHHLFLQRVLYRVNRLKLFWYDDLDRYKNEHSKYLQEVRERIESAWIPWELSQVQLPGAQTEIAQELQNRAKVDLDPLPTLGFQYFRDQVGMAGYRKLLEIASLDGLVEASQLSRTVGGVGNEIQAMMTRLLVEEYGGGRLNRKHSSFFTLMLEELAMDTSPEAYFQVVPWEVLATINHSFLLSERKRYYLRYVGGLLYTEISVPAAFAGYSSAAKRLGISAKARAYWDLHIKEDERHGRWMLNDVALPLAKLYPRYAREIVLGYDQQKFMSERAGKAIVRAVKQADLVADNSSSLLTSSYEAAA